jgi:hypothetical protein
VNIPVSSGPVWGSSSGSSGAPAFKNDVPKEFSARVLVGSLCQTITVFMRGRGNIARTRFSGRRRTHNSAMRLGSAATQSVSAAAIAAMMK